LRHITIQLKYISQGIRVRRGGTFPLKGRLPINVALDWIKEIKKEMEIAEILEVIYDGNNDITEEVNKFVKAPLNE
jgi:hypothetical protein